MGRCVGSTETTSAAESPMIPHPRAATPSHTLRLPSVCLSVRPSVSMASDMTCVLLFLTLVLLTLGEGGRRGEASHAAFAGMVGPGTSVASAAGCFLLYPCTGAEERATESWCSPSLLLAKTTNKQRLLVAIQFDGVFASSVIPPNQIKIKIELGQCLTVFSPIGLSRFDSNQFISIHCRNQIGSIVRRFRI